MTRHDTSNVIVIDGKEITRPHKCRMDHVSSRSLIPTDRQIDMASGACLIGQEEKHTYAYTLWNANFICHACTCLGISSCSLLFEYLKESRFTSGINFVLDCL